MSQTIATPENRVLMRNVSWERYLAILGDEEHDTRIAYNEGCLEIMTAGSEHESIKQLIARLLWLYGMKTDTNLRSVGNFTIKRDELQKGVEADDCYYIQSIEKVRDFLDITLPDDAPPDLAIEVDITSPSLDKLPIYAAIGVGEVWQYHQDHLVVLTRNDSPSFREHPTSVCLPSFPMDAIPVAIDQFRRGWSDNRIGNHFAAELPS